jgi:ribosomal protein S18 acetylase RimI-like enzyme
MKVSVTVNQLAGNIRIVELSPDEWQRLRDLKVSSLEQEPVAFSDPETSIQKYLKRTEDEWRQILSGKMSRGYPGRSLNIFAKDIDTNNLVGMVSAIILDGQRDGSVMATVQHMFVDKNYRIRKIGSSLLTELLHKLRNRTRTNIVELWVVTTQEAAISMYRGYGFTFSKNCNYDITRSGISCTEQQMTLRLYP